MADGMRRDDSSALYTILLLIVGLFIYFIVSTVADWLDLNWAATASLLFGLIGLLAGTIFVLLREFSLSKLFPWLLCGFYPFTLPALNYWSLSVPSRLLLRFNESAGDVDRLWYGQGWWQLLIFIGLVAGSYGWNKIRDDHY
jgi:ABC-type multidrug transport system permease subunit